MRTYKATARKSSLKVRNLNKLRLYIDELMESHYGFEDLSRCIERSTGQYISGRTLSIWSEAPTQMVLGPYPQRLNALVDYHRVICEGEEI